MRTRAFASTLAACLGGASAILRRAMRAQANRRVVMSLTGFDDHMLRDIGLMRADLASALAGTALDDPTERLALRAHEARANGRAAALEAARWVAMMGEAEATAKRPRRAA